MKAEEFVQIFHLIRGSKAKFLFIVLFKEERRELAKERDASSFDHFLGAI